MSDPLDFLLSPAPAPSEAQFTQNSLDAARDAAFAARDAAEAVSPDACGRGGYPYGHPIRVAAERAYEDAMRRFMEIWEALEPDPDRIAKTPASAPAPAQAPAAYPMPSPTPLAGAVDAADAAEAARRRAVRAARAAAGAR